MLKKGEKGRGGQKVNHQRRGDSWNALSFVKKRRYTPGANRRNHSDHSNKEDQRRNSTGMLAAKREKKKKKKKQGKNK